MAQTFDQVIQSVEQKKFAPLYFLYGEEAYFIDQIVDKIEVGVLDEAERDFNQNVFYGADIDMEGILAAAKRYPMMAPYQVIIIKEAQQMDGRGSPDKWNQLAEYSNSPMSSTILVFAYKYKKLDGRKAYSKTLEKNACAFESKKIKESLLPTFVQNYVKSRQYGISHKACSILLESLGEDLSKIVNELEKLMLNLPSKTEIQDTHIEHYIGISKDYNVFELQKALAVKDPLKVHKIVSYFAQNQKDHPIQMLIPILYSYFLKLLLYHNQVKKVSVSELPAKMGIPPFFLKEYEGLARLYPYGKSVQIVSLFREYDLKSKGVDATANTNAGELLKELIFKIMH